MTPRRTFTAALTAALLCVLAGPAASLAAGTATTPDRYGESTALELPAGAGAAKAQVVAGSGGSIVRTVIGLAVVIAVIYGLTWVLRQMRAAKQDRASGTGLTSEASIPLGQNRSVHLIRAGRELVLVGAAESGVVPIRTYSEDEARSLGLIDEDGRVPDAVAPRPAVATRGLVERLRERTVR